MNGGEQLWARCFASWLCVLQPAAMFALGVYFGRNGWRHGIYRMWVSIGGGR